MIEALNNLLNWIVAAVLVGIAVLTVNEFAGSVDSMDKGLVSALFVTGFIVTIVGTWALVGDKRTI